jgi:hypothetical protein
VQVPGRAAALVPRVRDELVCEGEVARQRGEEGGVDEEPVVSLMSSTIAHLLSAT